MITNSIVKQVRSFLRWTSAHRAARLLWEHGVRESDLFDKVWQVKLANTWTEPKMIDISNLLRDWAHGVKPVDSFGCKGEITDIGV